jgi:hypothetical protein
VYAKIRKRRKAMVYRHTVFANADFGFAFDPKL